MADNVKAMPGCSLPGKPNEQLVEMLERLLDKAKAGDITGMAGAFVTDDDCTGSFSTEPNGDADQLIAALEVVKYRYVRHIILIENEAG